MRAKLKGKAHRKQAGAFHGKVVLVTGGIRGIGKTIADAFGHAGARIALCDINQDLGKKVLLEFHKLGIESEYFRVDLSKKGQPQQMVNKVADTFGRLDILVNNARAGARLALSDDTEENWDLTMSVGLKAAYFASQQAIPIMGKNNGGSIINIGSVSAFLASRESGPYHAAKGGLLQLTRFLAANAGMHKVRVNSVLPGLIVQKAHRERFLRDDNASYRARAESCHPVGRVGDAEDVAAAILFLCSDASGFVTGQSIVVDGGLTIQDPWAVLSSFADGAGRQ
jgi:NAD(P)-dependent dehydrogenase (short-subunit alcohol dehydrogenase family)